MDNNRLNGHYSLDWVIRWQSTVITLFNVISLLKLSGCEKPNRYWDMTEESQSNHLLVYSTIQQLLSGDTGSICHRDKLV